MRDSTAAATARLHAAEEERDLTRRLKQALKAPDGERSAEAAALLAANLLPATMLLLCKSLPQMLWIWELSKV